jgi:mono/diheme cytochrome c family protein
MRPCIVVLLIASAAVTAVLSAQSPTSIKKVPLSPTSAVSGSQMFATYCAVCHGPDGKGRGPAASALKTAPTDLTQLAAKNQGKYPEILVANTLSAKYAVGAHGSQEMPIWGELFKSLDSGTNNMVQLRIVNLTSYVQSLQAR